MRRRLVCAVITGCAAAAAEVGTERTGRTKTTKMRMRMHTTRSPFAQNMHTSGLGLAFRLANKPGALGFGAHPLPAQQPVKGGALGVGGGETTTSRRATVAAPPLA